MAAFIVYLRSFALIFICAEATTGSKKLSEMTTENDDEEGAKRGSFEMRSLN